MRLAFLGTPDFSVAVLAALVEAGHEIVCAYSQPPAPRGRGQALKPSPVHAFAQAHGIAVRTPASMRDPGEIAAFAALRADAAVVVAFGQILPAAVLDAPRLGSFNLHASLLPRWRGAAPIQRAVMAGDEMTGASTFLIEEGLDSGPVYGVVTEAVRPKDTSGDLLGRLAVSGAGLLTATMDGIEDGSLVARPQPEDGVTLAPKITVEHAEVDWSAPALRVDRLVRGCTPAPGAWTLIGGERLKLGPVTPVPDRTDLAPGELAVAKNAVHVGTGSHAVLLGEVQAQGKKRMPAADWARGVQPPAGTVLGS